VGSYIAVSVDPASNPFPGSGPDERLIQLQELDLSIDRLNARREMLEGQEDIRAASQRAAEAETRLGQLKLDVDLVAREQLRLESDVDSMERKIEAERKRLYDGSVANAKELQSIEAEIASLTHRRSDKEDQVLELMEQREGLEARLSAFEAEATEARDRLAEIEQTSGQELVEVREALDQRTREREAMVPEFDPELLDLYEELRRSKRGVGVAMLTDGVCQGCHQKLSAMYLDRLKRAEGIRRCEYCRRILVFA